MVILTCTTTKNQQLTKVSASKNTHFSNCVSRQQCSFVKVTPSSGRANNAKLAASFESRTFTSCTRWKTVASLVRIGAVTPGVIRTANWCLVSTLLRELATTRAPNEYESLVANVTHANSVWDRRNCQSPSFSNMIRCGVHYKCVVLNFSSVINSTRARI